MRYKINYNSAFISAEVHVSLWALQAFGCTHLIKSLTSRKDKINSKGSEGKLSKLNTMVAAIMEPNALMGGTKIYA